jgi:hypothetical protein
MFPSIQEDADMPHKISYESNGLGVVLAFTGIIEADEINKLHIRLKSDESFLQWRYQIWDFSNATKLNISIDQIRRFAMQDAIAAHKNPHQKIALIPRESTHIGLDRAFHILEGVWGAYESKTFWDVNAAREWGESGRITDSRGT